MSEIVTVQLFPPVPVGLRAAPTSQGVLPVPIPCYEYPNAQDVRIEPCDPAFIHFTTRQGDTITSNLPFIVKREQKSEGEA